MLRKTSHMPADQMDPLLNLLNQRPREDWAWRFEPFAEGESGVNAVALCNASLLAYSPQADVRRFLTKWGFEEPRILGGGSTQGFVARRGPVVVVAFRGTEPLNAHNWLTDANYHQQKLPEVPGLVHAGFATALGAVSAELLSAVKQLVQGESTRIFVTGHSLGGALAVLAAAQLHFRSRFKIAGVFTYGQPRLADPEFSAAYNAALGDVTFRYVNDVDVVPHLPPARLPGPLKVRLPASGSGLLQKARELSGEIRGALSTMIQGAQFSHVGQLRLLQRDGSLTSDELEWQKREVIYSGTFAELLKNFPSLLQAQISQMLRTQNRVLDHDPLNGYLAMLEALRR